LNIQHIENPDSRKKTMAKRKKRKKERKETEKPSYPHASVSQIWVSSSIMKLLWDNSSAVERDSRKDLQFFQERE
jgi:hypothetical protein